MRGEYFLSGVCASIKYNHSIPFICTKCERKYFRFLGENFFEYQNKGNKQQNVIIGFC